MTIYIVSSFDEQFDGAGHDVRIMKAFDSESKAHEFMADCGLKLQQWEDTCPELEDNDDKWDKHWTKHPFRFDDGYMATGFKCEAIEVE